MTGDTVRHPNCHGVEVPPVQNLQSLALEFPFFIERVETWDHDHQLILWIIVNSFNLERLILQFFRFYELEDNDLKRRAYREFFSCFSQFEVYRRVVHAMDVALSLFRFERQNVSICN